MAYSSTMNPGLHEVLSHKTVFFITTAVKTSDPTEIYLIGQDLLLKPEGLSPLLYKPTTGLYLEPFQSSSYLHSSEYTIKFVTQAMSAMGKGQ
jgi:hypothetical protein